LCMAPLSLIKWHLTNYYDDDDDDDDILRSNRMVNENE